MSLRAGARDKLVTIQALGESVDAGGYPVEGWTDLTPPEWMARTDITDAARMAERFEAQQWTARAYADWRFAFRADMDPEVLNIPKTRRLVYRGRTYPIVQAARLPREDGYGVQVLTMDAQLEVTP